LKRLSTRSREETNFALAVNFGLNPQTGRLAGTLSCDGRLLDQSVATVLPDLYRAALAGLVVSPRRAWRSFPLCTGRVRALELAAAAGPAMPWTAETLVPEEVAAQARRTPDAPAVADERGALSYAELDRQANQVAHALRRRGVKAEDRVAVAMERSTALVVVLLGVWRAGAAYVPIDPGYPASRITGMLEDAAIRFVVADAADAIPLAITWSDLMASALREPATAPKVALDGEQLAYVIFTSGSTGRPKGVAVPHAALANHMAWMQGAFSLQSDDTVLQKTPISFDAAVWEFWAPLIAGARLVMARVGGHHDPAYLADVVRAEGVTVLQLVPSVLDFFLEEAAKRPPSALRRLFSGGEALRPATRDRCADVLPGVPLINLYGPAECTIDATFAVCAPTGAIPIGRPVANALAYVLDAHLEPVPAGVAGELYIGGAAVARGYWGSPELTAERFVPDALGATPGARLYRTGDRVRRGPDGALYYLGRADGQVKIRGQRVELGELETMLAQYPGVKSVAAAALADAEGNRRLIGYVVPADRFEAATCRAWLRERLPEALVPAMIVELERLPLSPGGKLDRAALPAPDFKAPAVDAHASRTAPSTPVQRVLADIWQRVLGVREAGLEDDFFAQGGDSILSLRLVSLAAQAGWKLRAGDVFAQPTLGGLAALARPVAAVAASVVFDANDVPLTPIQREFFALRAPKPEHWNQGVV
jgi:amino acid adenylation domain-containing protein